MKNLIAILLTAQIMLIISQKLFSQSNAIAKELGVTTGAFTNFPATQNYLKENIAVLYIAPYIRTGKHEFSAGIVYPMQTHALYFSDDNNNPRLGALAGYKFYIFNIYGRENLFVHYSFQYLRFSGNFDKYVLNNQPFHLTETDMYINNVVGLGYNLFFDTNERFGFYYILDCVISQTGYQIDHQGYNGKSWATQYVWNNLSTHIGFSFKLIPLKKKEKK